MARQAKSRELESINRKLREVDAQIYEQEQTLLRAKPEVRKPKVQTRDTLPVSERWVRGRREKVMRVNMESHGTVRNLRRNESRDGTILLLLLVMTIIALSWWTWRLLLAA